jgi:DNA-binding YbaB/EbfC family protein
MTRQPDFAQMMKAAQQMQEQVLKAQEEINKEVVEGSAGGVVTVKATGALEITEVKINPSVIDPDDAEFLEDTVLAAVNNALENARSLQQKKLGGLMGGMPGIEGLGLPGL